MNTDDIRFDGVIRPEGLRYGATGAEDPDIAQELGVLGLAGDDLVLGEDISTTDNVRIREYSLSLTSSPSSSPTLS
jgi:hypothetical protein